jgi:hypothetical protein
VLTEKGFAWREQFEKKQRFLCLAKTLGVVRARDDDENKLQTSLMLFLPACSLFSLPSCCCGCGSLDSVPNSGL